MLGRDEPAPVMPFLGPGIGIEQEGTRHRGLRKDIKHVPYVTGIYTNIVASFLADLAQQHRHAVDVGLAPDKAGVAVLHGLMHHVLAPAKTDFKPKWSTPEKRL